MKRDHDEAAVPAEQPDLAAAPAAAPDEDVIEGEIVESALTAHDLGIELPEDRAEAEAILVREISDARQEAGEYLETMQRVAAEFENYRKRTLRDQADTVDRASQRVIQLVLPTLDSFDAALTHEAASPVEEKLLAGMQGTYQLLMDALAKEGFTAIPAAGGPFDPAFHEAVGGPAEPGDGDLVVSQELRRGYVMRGRVIRPSLVMVEHA